MFPTRIDGTYDFQRYFELSPEQRRQALHRPHSVLKVLRTVILGETLPSGQDLYRAAAGYHAVFQHAGYVDAEVFESLTNGPKALMFSNLNPQDRTALAIAMNQQHAPAPQLGMP